MKAKKKRLYTKTRVVTCTWGQVCTPRSQYLPVVTNATFRSNYSDSLELDYDTGFYENCERTERLDELAEVVIGSPFVFDILGDNGGDGFGVGKKEYSGQ